MRPLGINSLVKKLTMVLVLGVQVLVANAQQEHYYSSLDLKVINELKRIVYILEGYPMLDMDTINDDAIKASKSKITYCMHIYNFNKEGSISFSILPRLFEVNFVKTNKIITHTIKLFNRTFYVSIDSNISTSSLEAELKVLRRPEKYDLEQIGMNSKSKIDYYDLLRPLFFVSITSDYTRTLNTRTSGNLPDEYIRRSPFRNDFIIGKDWLRPLIFGDNLIELTN